MPGFKSQGLEYGAAISRDQNLRSSLVADLLERSQGVGSFGSSCAVGSDWVEMRRGRETW